MRIKALSMSIILIGLISSAWATQTEAPNNSIPELTVGTINQINDINILDFYFSAYRMALTHQGLVRFNKSEVVSELATSWETQDLKTWRFQLRNDAKWHDGLPVNSNDVKFSIDYSLEKDPTAIATLGNVNSVEVINDTAIEIDLKKPDYNFLTMLTRVLIIPEHIFKNVADPSKFNSKDATIGCGPYKFVSLDKDAGIVTFSANEEYWGGKPAIDTVKIRMFKNTDSLMLAFQKGEVDLPFLIATGISYYYVPKLLENTNIKIDIYPEMGITEVLWFNTAKAPYNDKQLRQAFSYALNYEELENMFTAGYGISPNAGWIPEGFPNHIETRPLSYDMNKSKSMLDSLGFKDQDGDDLREMPDGSKFQPHLITRSDLEDGVRAAEMMQKYFEDVGIDLKVDVQDRSTTFDIVETEKSYDMALLGCIWAGMMMGEGYGSYLTDARYWGWSNVNDPEYQSIVDSLGSTQDKEMRKELAAEIQRYYAEEMPQFTVYSINIIQPYNAKYTGWEFSPLQGILSYGTLFNLHEA